jgi:hypothetical protein
MAKDRAADANGEKQLAELKSAKELTIPEDEPIKGLQERDSEVPRH